MLTSELGEGFIMNAWRFLIRWFVPPFIGLVLVFGFMDKIQDQYHVQLPGALEVLLGPNYELALQE
jgi:NSS family neurotransmitter:Na+ symporter